MTLKGGHVRFGRRRGKEPRELDPTVTQGLQALEERHAELLAELTRLQREVATIGSTRSRFEGQATLAEQREVLAADEEKAAERGRDDLVARARELMRRLEAKSAEIEGLHRETVQTEASLIQAERKARQAVDELTAQKAGIEDHVAQLRNLLGPG